MSAEANSEAGASAASHRAELRLISLCSTCMGQGLGGLDKLKQIIQKAGNAEWVRALRLNDAIMGGSVPVVRYLVETVKIEHLNTKTHGYSPLQFAVVWGKTNILVYLLSMGADPMLKEESVVDMGRLRQQRLQTAFDEAGEGAEFEGVSITKDKIVPLIKAGAAMLEVLEGTEATGSFSTWARQNPEHPLVKQFAGKVKSAEPRYQFAVVRDLVQKERAGLLPLSKRLALAAHEAAKAAALAKEERPMKDLLVDNGFTADAAKCICGQFKTIETAAGLRYAKLSAATIEKALEVYVRTKILSEGDERKFQRFVRELGEPPAQAAAPGPATKAKAKAKSKVNPALMALARKSDAKASGYPANSAAAPAKTKAATANDAMSLLFHPDFPASAFMVTTCFLLGINRLGGYV